jgi:peptide/nickel transport system substrate-binding protein
MTRFNLLCRRIVAPLLLTAWSLGAHASPAPGGTLTVGLYSAPASLDPAGQSGDAGAQAVMYAVYDPLVDVQGDGTYKPALATKVERSADSRVWTVTLRSGVLFHDGTPFNAQAVAAHFKRLADPATRCTCLSTVQAIESVATPNAQTVVFTLARGWAAFAVQVLGNSFAFIPSPTAVAAAGADYPSRPVGTGPFKLVQFSRGDRIVVERNAAYWRSGLPHLDRVVFRPLPDEQTRLQSLRAGDIDLMQTINPAQAEQARAAGLQARINIGQGSQMVVFDNTREPFNDARVRRALALAVNRDAMVKLMTNGMSKPGAGPLAEGSPFNGKAAWPKYDPNGARELLKAYGKPVAFEMLAPASPDGRKQAEILQQMWRAVGAQVSIAPVDTPQLIDRVLLKKNYQAAAWVGQEYPEPDGLYDGYHSSGRLNIMRYANPKVDALLQLARLNADPKARLDLYQQASQLLADDVPAIYLTRKIGALVYKPQVQNVPASEWVGVQIFRPTEIWVQQKQG